MSRAPVDQIRCECCPARPERLVRGHGEKVRDFVRRAAANGWLRDAGLWVCPSCRIDATPIAAEPPASSVEALVRAAYDLEGAGAADWLDGLFAALTSGPEALTRDLRARADRIEDKLGRRQGDLADLARRLAALRTAALALAGGL